MTKSITLIIAAVFIGGCASTQPAEQPVFKAMSSVEPYYFEVDASTSVDEAAYVHVLNVAECTSIEKFDSGRSRCH